MNNEPVFNLDRAIAEWRRRIRASGIAAHALDELESHLREDVERQTKSGIDSKHAFENAAQHIGSANAIAAEFKKVPAAALKREQQVMRIYCLVFPIFYACVGGYGLLNNDISFAERTLGFLAVALTCGFILGTTHCYKLLPTISNRGIRQGIQIGGVLSWLIGCGIVANFVLPHLNLTAGQLVVFFLWLMLPTAVLSGISYGLGEAALRNTTGIVH